MSENSVTLGVCQFLGFSHQRYLYGFSDPRKRGGTSIKRAFLLSHPPFWGITIPAVTYSPTVPLTFTPQTFLPVFLQAVYAPSEGTNPLLFAHLKSLRITMR